MTSPGPRPKNSRVQKAMAHDTASLLVEALPYIQRFRGKIVVVKYGGAAMDDPDLVAGVMRDIVFLEAVGINPVVVHGGGKAITHAMEQAGLEARWVQGRRYTDDATLAIVAFEQGEVTLPYPAVIQRIAAVNGLAGKLP